MVCYKLNESKRLENIAKTQPRKFWKSIKKCYNKTNGPKDSINIDDLYEHFNELLGQNQDDNENGNMDFTNISDDDLDCKISEQEVRRAVFKQNNRKASGPDEIPTEII